MLPAMDYNQFVLNRYSPNQWRMLKHVCEKDVLDYTRFIFKHRENRRFIVNEHHRIIASALMRVYCGHIKRLIINVPPGYTKTELAVINFISWCLAKKPTSLFIHTSYSDDLALLNSSKIRDTINLEAYQALWPMQLRTDSKAKKRWYTELGGGLMAASTGGQITGFRAGRMEKGFSGALIIDDPIKPEDAVSDVKRLAINRSFNSTLKNRLAVESVPIIVIMQRVHEDDLTGFLLRGGSGEKWHHLEMPVQIDSARDYPNEYTHGIPIDYFLFDGPLWELKHNKEDISSLKKSDIYIYSSQYDQRPSPEGGSLFRKEWFQYYKEYDPKNALIELEDGNKVNIEYLVSYSDTAMKTGEKNDYTVFQLWGKGKDGKIYLIDQARGKWEAPQLERKYERFHERHEYKKGEKALGLRARKVEDKVSGTGLIQSLNNKYGVNWIEGIQRDRDKVSRARSCSPKIANGLVVLPRNAFWLDEYIYEFEKFSPHMTHKHDDQIDPTLDAIHDMLIDIGHTIDYSSIL